MEKIYVVEPKRSEKSRPKSTVCLPSTSEG